MGIQLGGRRWRRGGTAGQISWCHRDAPVPPVPGTREFYPPGRVQLPGEQGPPAPHPTQTISVMMSPTPPWPGPRSMPACPPSWSRPAGTGRRTPPSSQCGWGWSACPMAPGENSFSYMKLSPFSLLGGTFSFILPVPSGKSKIPAKTPPSVRNSKGGAFYVVSWSAAAGFSFLWAFSSFSAWAWASASARRALFSSFRSWFRYSGGTTSEPLGLRM